ncbi:Rid family detoxifying hydrolase [Hydrogenophaga sp.]|uniref:Rid family detoxifying hydrolase n=1 Tax=Hydrogenophaga sp. TaxID=1904254 RepID=UPI00272578E6|nr:Rid family detoxifying hydrolase [Hydrogenophaga sp.]MDO9435719.1 Rid family detoxifying hydrolase [Hydrogenophaga sp.]
MHAISTTGAPAALGTYSQGIRYADTLLTAGQIGLDPSTLTLADGVDAQVRRVFDNLRAICQAAGSDLDGIVRLGVYLVDAADWPVVNQVMADYFKAPFPARTAIGVAWLPMGARVEIDAVVMLPAAETTPSPRPAARSGA